MSDPLFHEGWAEPFNASAFRLRFELGGDFSNADEVVPRFVRAFGKARTIIHDALAPAERVIAIVGCWPQSENDLFAPAEEGFEALKQAGFRSQPFAEGKGGHPRYGNSDDEEWQRSATWRAFDLTSTISDRDVAIWCAVAYEMAVSPKAPVTSFLIDLDRGILVHVYDDRGMDLISLSPETLEECYQKHNEWLLDYDRERIAAAFGLSTD